MTGVSDTSDVPSEWLVGGHWSCEVTAYDGTEYSSSISDSATVENGCNSLEFNGNTDRLLITHPNLPSGNAARTFTVCIC